MHLTVSKRFYSWYSLLYFASSWKLLFLLNQTKRAIWKVLPCSVQAMNLVVCPCVGRRQTERWRSVQVFGRHAPTFFCSSTTQACHGLAHTTRTYTQRQLMCTQRQFMYKDLYFKGEIRCKMDLGYVWYDNELECLFWSKKAHIDAFFRWLFLADSIKTL